MILFCGYYVWRLYLLFRLFWVVVVVVCGICLDFWWLLIVLLLRCDLERFIALWLEVVGLCDCFALLDGGLVYLKLGFVMLIVLVWFIVLLLLLGFFCVFWLLFCLLLNWSCFACCLMLDLFGLINWLVIVVINLCYL